MIKLPNKIVIFFKTRLENTQLSVKVVQGYLGLRMSLKLSLCLLPRNGKKKKTKEKERKKRKPPPPKCRQPLIIKLVTYKQTETTLWRNIRMAQGDVGIGFCGVCRKLSNWTRIEPRQLSRGTGPRRPALL